MMERIAEASPRLKARLAGMFFLLAVLTGVYAQMFVSGRLVVEDDAATTATNILTHRSMYQLSFTLYLIEMACNIVITALFYDLLKPVSSSVSLLAAFFNLVGSVIKILSRLFYVSPLLVLEGPHYLSVFNREQLQALALLSVNVNHLGAGIAMVFFGFSTLLKGYLIVRSTFLPRILGVASGLAGLGWLTFLSPPLGYRLYPYVAVLGLLSATATILWLLVFGVNEQRWKEQAVAAEGRRS